MLDETMSATLTASESESDDDDNTIIMPETAVPHHIDGNQKYASYILLILL